MKHRKTHRDVPRQPAHQQGRWVIGLHSCQEALKVRPQAIAEAFLRTDWQDSSVHRKMFEDLQKVRIKPQLRSMDQLQTYGSGHQGCVFRVTENPTLSWERLKEPGRQVLLILDGIEDPQNLGNILRTAWLTGVSGILIPENRAVGLTATVSKIASGGAEHVPIESHSSFSSAIKSLKEAGFWIYGLAEEGSQPPWSLELPEKVVWVIGSEGRGLRLPTERLCDELIRLPQVSSGSSYNAAVSACMALYETMRQFSQTVPKVDAH